MISIEKAMETKHPLRVALVVCRGTKGDIDITPINWFTNVSWKTPRTWLISLNKEHYSTHVISKTGEFTLCFPTTEQIRDVKYCGRISGRKTHKLMHCNFSLVPSKKVKPPMIKGCTGCFECKVIWKKLFYNQVAFVGKVVSADILGKGRPLFTIKGKKLGGIR